jgi:hypothetical protein
MEVGDAEVRATPRIAPSRILMAVLLAGACGLQEHPLKPITPVTPGAGGSGGAPPAGAGGSTQPPPSGGTRGDGGAGGASGRGGSGGTAGTIAIDGSMTTYDAGPVPNPNPTPNPPPINGPSVTINGVVVPREKAIVILHLGHSNMAGRAKDPADQMPYFYDLDPHLWQYQLGGVWKPAKEPLCPDGGTPGVRPNNQGAGPGMALLRHALAVAPDAYIISIGQGMSLDYGASCFTFRKGGLFFDKVAGPARELKGKVTFGGLFVMFSYDARTDPPAQNGGFVTCLQGLAADFRAELDAPNLPFVIGDYERGATRTFRPDCCGAPQVIAQLARVPMAIPNSFLIPSDGIAMQDDHHYNMAGHRLWAERAFAGMAGLNMLPWATVK